MTLIRPASGATGVPSTLSSIVIAYSAPNNGEVENVFLVPTDPSKPLVPATRVSPLWQSPATYAVTGLKPHTAYNVRVDELFNGYDPPCANVITMYADSGAPLYALGYFTTGA